MGDRISIARIAAYDAECARVSAIKAQRGTHIGALAAEICGYWEELGFWCEIVWWLCVQSCVGWCRCVSMHVTPTLTRPPPLTSHCCSPKDECEISIQRGSLASLGWSLALIGTLQDKVAALEREKAGREEKIMVRPQREGA